MAVARGRIVLGAVARDAWVSVFLVLKRKRRGAGGMMTEPTYALRT